MKKAILTTKVGMTQVFSEDGVLTPVTVLQAGPCVVTQVKTVENDGYSAVQVGFGDIREKLVNKPKKGHFAKAGVTAKRFLKEFRLEDAESYTLGQEIKADVFAAGVNIVQNNGEAAGQTVFHFHMHIIPRYKDDGQVIGWEPHTSDPEVQAQLAEKIGQAIH